MNESTFKTEVTMLARNVLSTDPKRAQTDSIIAEVNDSWYVASTRKAWDLVNYARENETEYFDFADEAIQCNKGENESLSDLISNAAFYILCQAVDDQMTVIEKAYKEMESKLDSLGFSVTHDCGGIYCHSTSLSDGKSLHIFTSDIDDSWHASYDPNESAQIVVRDCDGETVFECEFETLEQAYECAKLMN